MIVSPVGIDVGAHHDLEEVGRYAWVTTYLVVLVLVVERYLGISRRSDERLNAVILATGV